MLSHQQLIHVLHNVGCVISEGITEEQVKNCYTVLKKLSENTQHEVTVLKKRYALKDYEAFSEKITDIKRILSDCRIPFLVTDCNLLTQYITERKYSLCEILIDKFISSLLSLSISFLMAEYQASEGVGTDSVQRMDFLIKHLELAVKAFDDKNAISILNELDTFDCSSDIHRYFRIVRNHIQQMEFRQADRVIENIRQAISQNRNLNEKNPVSPMILAVDDHPEILVALKALLGKRYRFFAVTSGEEALKFLEGHAPDLCLCDILMPGMNGFELASRINAGAKKTPVVFLTGSSSREDVFRALSVGAVDFIVKPLNEDIILPKLESIFSHM